MKVSIEEIESVLLKSKVDPKVVGEVVKELETIAEEVKQERQGVPKAKNEYLILLSDPNGDLTGKDFTGWVVQMKQGDDAGQVVAKLKEAAQNHIAAQKRKRKVINTLGDAILYVKRKWFKEKNLTVKTKEPVRVLLTNNKL
jgi:hypothetical protein